MGEVEGRPQLTVKWNEAKKIEAKRSERSEKKKIFIVLQNEAKRKRNGFCFASFRFEAKKNKKRKLGTLPPTSNDDLCPSFCLILIQYAGHDLMVVWRRERLRLASQLLPPAQRVPENIRSSSRSVQYLKRQCHKVFCLCVHSANIYSSSKLETIHSALIYSRLARKVCDTLLQLTSPLMQIT